ncbi:hypothetical protein GL218_05431 [Daldinia childiae]|uniref:uncharacterized protein n=1 Tax=Daldinia childiae TaxID=326645 RepID=UPI0014486245|nr:uncharacterized protein GL218_05431 [Daldinia childiae]KAF3058212.1 hypothetical protein GL218_05431 [Daldinia childiae]
MRDGEYSWKCHVPTKNKAVRSAPNFSILLTGLFPPTLCQPTRRQFLSTTTKNNATVSSTSSSSTDPSGSRPKRKPLTKEQRDFLSSAMPSIKLRVNQAGELAATLIYTAQTPPLVNAHPIFGPY